MRSLSDSDARANWREIPFGELRASELALMSQEEKRWYGDWQRDERFAKARMEAVNAVVRKASKVVPECSTCECWHNGRGGWGACTSRDSMGPDEPRVKTRSTLGGDTCEAWQNSNARLVNGSYVGVEVAA